MNVNVLFFGRIAEITGTDRLLISNVDTSYELKSQLLELYPALKDMTYSMAVNREIVRDDIPLNDGDDVAFLPPFSGG